MTMCAIKASATTALETTAPQHNPAFVELLEALLLEQVAQYRFVGKSFDFVGARIFGGQVLAQALLAGFATLDVPRACHSLHAYFLRGGDVDYPVQYQVSVLRDGQTLSARQIIASQTIAGQEVIIFTMMASFAAPAPDPLPYQIPAPTYAPPEQIASEDELIAAYLSNERTPEWLKARLIRPRPLLIKPLDPAPLFDAVKQDPKQALWLKIDQILTAAMFDKMPHASETVFHQACLAFASDYYLVATMLRSHGLTIFSPQLQVASIDHSLHFHRPFSINEWLLYELSSDVSSFDKGLSHGHFWQHGQLIATSQQEGLMRYRPERKQP